MIHGLHHVAVGVPDIEAGLAFYVGALGAELLWRSAIDGSRPEVDQVIGIEGVQADVAMLRLGGAHVELWTYRAPTPVDRISPANALGYPHIALSVSDIAAEHERLTAAGMTFVGPPVLLPGSKAIYGRDPFGNLIELYETGLA
jgi:catechol 2,3-dioxygenase-like lactoylglutathione lyase family enzyme